MARHRKNPTTHAVADFHFILQVVLKDEGKSEPALREPRTEPCSEDASQEAKTVNRAGADEMIVPVEGIKGCPRHYVGMDEAIQPHMAIGTSKRTGQGGDR